MSTKLTNNAAAVLAAAVSASSTTVSLLPGTGGAFPVLAAGDWFPATIVKSTGENEIVRVTARSGDVFTVERAQEGTPAREFSPGDRIEHRLTAGVLSQMMAETAARLPLAGGTVTGALNVDGALTQGGQQVWHTGNLTPSDYLPVAGGTISGALDVTGDLKKSGNAVWHAGNFNPASYMPVNGGAMGGPLNVAGAITQNGAQVWHAENLNPGAYLPLAGGTVSGVLNVGGALTQGGQQVWHGGNFSPANYMPKAGGTMSGALNVAGAITQNGAQVWHTGNLNPGAYMPVSGGAFTGMLYTASINGAMAADSSTSLEVRSGGGAGDGGMAMIGFHAQGYYAIKMGVRADGYFGLGGWSRAAWSWYSTSNGDMVAAGNVGAYSDPRLKEDVEVIGGALGIIEGLRGVRFTWNNKTKLIGKPGERDIGVMADEVEAVLPEIVGRSIPDDENGGEQWRIVAYDKLVPVLIEAVKELAAEVRTMNRGL